ncbi:MAG: hypothetical protein J6J23_04035 [Clostridia bacterium]|nr:hypothetical protein [Clostridia bacterium]
MKNEIAVKKVMVRFLVECQKFVGLRDKKKREPLNESEEIIFKNAKNVIMAYGIKLRDLGVSAKDIARVMLDGLKSVNLVSDNAEQKGVTAGEATAILNQFIDVEGFVRTDSGLVFDSLEVVRASHTLNILAKYAPFYGDHEKVFEQEEKLDALVESFRDKYINPEVVGLSIERASEFFNGNELEQYGQPVDHTYVTSLILDTPHADEKDGEEGANE